MLHEASTDRNGYVYKNNRVRIQWPYCLNVFPKNTDMIVESFYQLQTVYDLNYPKHAADNVILL